MKISQIMKRSFLCLDANERLSAAAAKLAKEKVSEAPVTQRQKFIGLFTTSDIARLLVKQSMVGKPQQAADFAKKKNDPLFKHVRAFSHTLEPDSDIISAYLVLLHSNVDIIPVLGKDKKLLGVVMATDIRKNMVRMLSEGGTVPSRAALNEEREQEKIMEPAKGQTALDNMLSFVQKKGTTTAQEISLKFGVPVNDIEEYAVSLEEHGLLRLEYDFFGKMKLRRVE